MELPNKNISRRSKERHLLSTGTNKISNYDEQSAKTYFTSNLNRPVSTAVGGRKSDATAAMLNYLNQSVIDEYNKQSSYGGGRGEK